MYVHQVNQVITLIRSLHRAPLALFLLKMLTENGHYTHQVITTVPADKSYLSFRMFIVKRNFGKL